MRTHIVHAPPIVTSTPILDMTIWFGNVLYENYYRNMKITIVIWRLHSNSFDLFLTCFFRHSFRSVLMHFNKNGNTFHVFLNGSSETAQNVSIEKSNLVETLCVVLLEPFRNSWNMLLTHLEALHILIVTEQGICDLLYYSKLTNFYWYASCVHIADNTIANRKLFFTFTKKGYV